MFQQGSQFSGSHGKMHFSPDLVFSRDIRVKECWWKSLGWPLPRLHAAKDVATRQRRLASFCLAYPINFRIDVAIERTSNRFTSLRFRATMLNSLALRRLTIFLFRCEDGDRHELPLSFSLSSRGYFDGVIRISFTYDDFVDASASFAYENARPRMWNATDE